MKTSKVERITIAGFGGQGVMMLGQILAHTAIKEQLNSTWYPSYGPETRGGTANCAVIISNELIYSPVFRLSNTLIIFNGPSLDKFQNRIHEDGLLLYNSSLIDKEKVTFKNSYGIPVNDLANQLGNPKVINMIMLGAYLELRKTYNLENILHTLQQHLGERKKDLLDINIKAIEAGRKYIMELML